MENKKIEKLNKEYNKYSQAIVRLLDISLKEGEYFMFAKLKEGGYGIIISEEREKIVNTSPSKITRLLKVLKEKDLEEEKKLFERVKLFGATSKEVTSLIENWYEDRKNNFEFLY